MTRTIEQGIFRALDRLGELEPLFRGRHVAVKPNETLASDEDLTACTQADSLAAVIRYIGNHPDIGKSFVSHRDHSGSLSVHSPERFVTTRVIGSANSLGLARIQCFWPGCAQTELDFSTTSTRSTVPINALTWK